VAGARTRGRRTDPHQGPAESVRAGRPGGRAGAAVRAGRRAHRPALLPARQQGGGHARVAAARSPCPLRGRVPRRRHLRRGRHPRTRARGRPGVRRDRGQSLEQLEAGAHSRRRRPGPRPAARRPVRRARGGDAPEPRLPPPRPLEVVRAGGRDGGGRGGAARRPRPDRRAAADARGAAPGRPDRRALHQALRLSLPGPLLEAAAASREHAVPHRAPQGARVRGGRLRDDLRPADGPRALRDPRPPGAGGDVGAARGAAGARGGPHGFRRAARVPRFRDRGPRDPALRRLPAVGEHAGAVQLPHAGAEWQVRPSRMDRGRAG